MREGTPYTPMSPEQAGELEKQQQRKIGKERQEQFAQEMQILESKEKKTGAQVKMAEARDMATAILMEFDKGADANEDAIRTNYEKMFEEVAELLGKDYANVVDTDTLLQIVEAYRDLAKNRTPNRRSAETVRDIMGSAMESEEYK